MVVFYINSIWKKKSIFSRKNHVSIFTMVKRCQFIFPMKFFIFKFNFSIFFLRHLKDLLLLNSFDRFFSIMYAYFRKKTPFSEDIFCSFFCGNLTHISNSWYFMNNVASVCILNLFNVSCITNSLILTFEASDLRFWLDD